VLVLSGSRSRNTGVILGVVSSEYVDCLRQALQAMSEGDVDAVIGMCTDDVLFLPGRSALQGGYVGPAGLRKWFADNTETFEVFAATWNEMFDAGEQVVSIGQVTVRPRGGGPEASVPAAFVVSFRNGKIARAEDLRDRDAALAAVGLPA
jgi:ketosteroid isomerase-like protein